MPNLNAILKAEITRLARRSMRPVYASLKKDITNLKRVVAHHKRILAQLTRDDARLMAELNAKLAVLGISFPHLGKLGNSVPSSVGAAERPAWGRPDE